MNACKRFAVIAALSVLFTPAVYAQRATPALGPELGIDGEIAFGTGDQSFTQIALPVQRFRVGFYSSPAVEWEPWAALNYRSTKVNTVTTLGLGLGALLHLSDVRTQAQWYVRPFADLMHLSDNLQGTTFTTDQWGLGVGGGVKVPLADRLGTRFEADLEHVFAHDNSPSYNQIGLLAGFSYYVH